MLHHKKRVEWEFDKTQPRRANQLLIIDSKNNKGLSTQHPLQEIKSNCPNSCNNTINDSNIEDNVENAIEHDHNYMDPTEHETQPDQIDAPTEEPSSTNALLTLTYAIATFNSECINDQHQNSDDYTQNIEETSLHSN